MKNSTSELLANTAAFTAVLAIVFGSCYALLCENNTNAEKEARRILCHTSMLEQCFEDFACEERIVIHDIVACRDECRQTQLADRRRFAQQYDNGIEACEEH